MHDSIDDAAVFAGVARALAEKTGDKRFADYFKFVTEKKAKVYLQRVFDNSTTTRGTDGPYNVDKMMAGDYGGEPGAALMLFRTYPRVPFWEQIHDSIPFYTDSGRLASYCDLPEAIEYGENLIVHREAVEATPYLPNVIVSTSPYIRPVDLRNSARHDRPRPAAGAQHQDAVERGEEDGQSAVAAGLSILLLARPRAGTRRIRRGPPSIGTGSGATTLAIRTAPTSARPASPIGRFR